VTALCIGFFGALVGMVGIAYAMVAVPDENKTATAQNNVYYWADGTQMVATGGAVNRQNITYDQIPLAMRYAVISAENKTFETDKGVDPMGITRALYNMAKGGETQGGSTITQQYVKNSMLDQSQTVSRKFKELFISIKVGAQKSKNDIITGYLNTSYFGRNAYGLQAAAQTYYGIDAEKLNPSQCAFLAALLKGPTYYDPIGAVNIDPAATADSNMARSKARWSWILDQEVRYGHMTAQERAKWTRYPMPLGLKVQAGMTGQVSYLVDTANHYVAQHSDITEDMLTHGGYQIYTTFEKDKVAALQKAVQNVRKAHIKPGGTHLEPDGKTDADTNVQYGAASVVPGDGKIVAIYGGEGYENHQFNNNADTSGIPVGSTFKPFVLAAAMTYGTDHSDGKPITPDSKYNADDELEIRDHNGNLVLNKDGSVFKQKNEDSTKWGYIPLSEAMQYSINSPFVQLGEDVGLDKVRNMAQAAGLLPSSFESLNASFSIGTSTPSAIRMADAYATFAESGRQVEPYSVTKVMHDGGEVPGFQKPKPKIAMDANVANNVTKVLENVVKKGTGTKALELGRTVAGKTGTTDSPGGTRSAWFVGYTEQYSTSVVMYREDTKKHELLPMAGTGGNSSVHGGDLPATIWTQYMKAALGNSPDTPFPPAESIGAPQNEPGAPSPTPSMTTAPPTTAPATTPSVTTPPSPTWTPPGKSSPTATPSQACFPWDKKCATPTPTTTSTTPTATPTTTGGGRGPGGLGG
jgi:membrane peptidoglycan carboxypeptidase